ncbi:2-octaprenyl-3-methyl-6-methoxy-1,4-benzoquinol hydroxylase [hydrothermal vent metagenome]|uniref:2-octaprenyl-3-methyl-6-methoxy-1,4-benzoquinol hydroxylase n=1 Tax=hydrothermal vent metagenome TaxID=652676 RepID=A0A1W1CAP4_9ZZZZ
MNYDIIIVGGGPTGLAFAQLVANYKIKVLVIEKSSLENIKNPKVDGREIALTHSSVEILKKINAWENIPQEHISFIEKAHVLNGNSPETLIFDAKKEKIKNLGYLIPNYLIRQGIYNSIKNNVNITIKTECEVQIIKSENNKKTVILNNGDKYSSSLLIGADSRFSETRKQMGISAKMQDFAKTMLVCEMKHNIPHQQIASEYFFYEQIIAILPMPENHSSVVITLKNDEAKQVLKMSDTQFNNYVEESLNNNLGEMKLIGKIHSYPLIGVYADTFIKERFALIGDAAVGMHPVTAHGFNLGLRGSDILGKAIIKASRRNQDIGSDFVLKEYQNKYRLISKIMFSGTNSLVSLFSQATPKIKLLRKLVIKASIKVPLVNKLISAHLTEKYRKQRNLLPFL